MRLAGEIELIVNIKNIVEDLNLDVYTKGYERCDIGSVRIDEIIVIRLRI